MLVKQNDTVSACLVSSVGTIQFWTSEKNRTLMKMRHKNALIPNDKVNFHIVLYLQYLYTTACHLSHGSTGTLEKSTRNNKKQCHGINIVC